VRTAAGTRPRPKLLHAAADLAPRDVLVRHGSRKVPRVALTFDDGPDEMTPQYLDVLDRLAVRATFFLIGQSCARWPGAVRAIVARGHEVASHGHTHKTFPSLSARDLAEELARVQELQPPTERRRALLRPPRGAISPWSLIRCAAAGYTTVLWSLDSDDCRTTSSGEVVARVAGAEPGEVVLLHEGQSWTIDALPAVVGSLRDRGLELVTVGEMLG
jgi:peptidoglycan/xylan/chitin deacetylase (PgdA/CDA1 family)